MTQQYIFLCLLLQSSPKAWQPHSLHPQYELVADHSDADSISSVLSLIFCCCGTRHDTYFSKGDEMIWQCLQCFHNASFQENVLYFVHVFFSLALFVVQFLFCLSDRGLQRQMTWRQCPITSFCLLTESCFCNPYLMKVLAKSTTETKTVKLVRSRLFGSLPPSNRG